MNQFILGIDAGGTKTLGQLKCVKSNQVWQVRGGPGSLSIDLTQACQNISDVISNLLSQANCKSEDVVLVCGAAGINRLSKAALNKTLSQFSFANTLITTDARISLYGAGEGNPIIVVALGTGSVAMRLDEQANEKQFGGWGLSVGDKGSGAHIGREVITKLLFEFDKDDFQADAFTDKIFSIIGSNKLDIAQWLTEATSTIFAEMAPLVLEHITQSTLAKTVVDQAINDVERLINLAQGSNRLPVCLIGGLAESFTPLLLNKMTADENSSATYQIIPARGNAVDGALYLANELNISEQACYG